MEALTLGCALTFLVALIGGTVKSEEKQAPGYGLFNDAFSIVVEPGMLLSSEILVVGRGRVFIVPPTKFAAAWQSTLFTCKC